MIPPDDARTTLGLLTGDILPVRKINVRLVAGEVQITKGGYYMKEEELPEEVQPLLHGRGFIVDRELITETNALSPRTYYIAADKTQGLIVPSRALSIGTEEDTLFYRWTDDGEKFTSWRTLKDGSTDSYLSFDNSRFGELQVYSEIGQAYASIVAVR